MSEVEEEEAAGGAEGRNQNDGKRLELPPWKQICPNFTSFFSRADSSTAFLQVLTTKAMGKMRRR